MQELQLHGLQKVKGKGVVRKQHGGERYLEMNSAGICWVRAQD